LLYNQITNIMTKREQLVAKVSKAVEAYFDKNATNTRVPLHIIVDGEAKGHVINIGTSIMLNRLGVNTYPGSFVQAVLDNDLHGAFSKADSVNAEVLRFYITMMYNLGIDITIQEIKEAS
jgi:hypothetical protein